MNCSGHQIHSHSKSRLKLPQKRLKNIDCRYYFVRFFTFSEQLLLILYQTSGDEQESILQKRNAILNVVKEYIDTYLDPRKSKYFGYFKIRLRKTEGYKQHFTRKWLHNTRVLRCIQKFILNENQIPILLTIILLKA